MKNRIIIIGGLLLVLITGCRQPETGIGPIRAIGEIPEKILMNETMHAEVFLNVDVERFNPLNAKDYFFGSADGTRGDDDILLFNYVVLSYSYLIRDSAGLVQLEMTSALRRVLANSKTLLRPLRREGIKVLIEVRSGICEDNEPGTGLGLGTLDMAEIEEFLYIFRLLVDRYDIDGFEFNDTGGGYLAYPPYTRDKKFSGTGESMYDSLFKDKDGNPISYSEEETNKILWIEGGNNLTNLAFKVNEHIKDLNEVVADYGSPDNDNQTVATRRRPVLRDSGHGAYLLAEVRMAYMPDAYTGATSNVPDNLRFVIHHGVNSNESAPHPVFIDELSGQNAGIYTHDKYAPYIIDLENRLTNSQASDLAQWAYDNRYGAVYFMNLPAIPYVPAESSTNAAGLYMSRFTLSIFGRQTRLYQGGGDHE